MLTSAVLGCAFGALAALILGGEWTMALLLGTGGAIGGAAIGQALGWYDYHDRARWLMAAWGALLVLIAWRVVRL